METLSTSPGHLLATPSLNNPLEYRFPDSPGWVVYSIVSPFHVLPEHLTLSNGSLLIYASQLDAQAHEKRNFVCLFSALPKSPALNLTYSRCPLKTC